MRKVKVLDVLEESFMVHSNLTLFAYCSSERKPSSSTYIFAVAVRFQRVQLDRVRLHDLREFGDTSAQFRGPFQRARQQHIRAHSTEIRKTARPLRHCDTDECDTSRWQCLFTRGDNIKSNCDSGVQLMAAWHHARLTSYSCLVTFGVIWDGSMVRRGSLKEKRQHALHLLPV